MKRLALIGAASAALCSFALGDSLVHAQDPPPPAPAPDATTQVTLPLLGSPLTVDVTTDAGGGLVDVTLSPTEGYDPAKVRPNTVAFVNEEGGVALKVSAKHGGERVTARAGSLADISGPGQWSGDVFDSGEQTTVDFTIGAGADGGPDITGISVASPLEHVIGDVRRGSDDHAGDTVQTARVTIEFTRQGQTRSLSIRAWLVNHDGDTKSALKIGLSRVKGRLLAEGPAVGPHSWSGQLCDGTAASITYNVSDQGAITDVVATPEADVRAEGGRARVAFSDRERISIKVRGEGDEMTVGTSEQIRCGRNDPTVNGEAVDRPDDDGHDHGDGQGDGGGRHGGGWWGGGDHGGDGKHDGDGDGGGSWHGGGDHNGGHHGDDG